MNNFNLISAYIATIIILIITIGIGAVLYLYFSGYISQLTSETEETTTIKSIIECSQAKIDSYVFREITLKDFNYRIPINITERSGNTLTDYQVLVVINTQELISQGKMRSDCGDIRFTDSDGITLLNYWIESGCNTNNTRIWVKVPNIPANSNKTIYLYYGNPYATSMSNGDLVFDFFDDFEGTSLDTSKWISYSNNYTLSNGILRINTGGIERTEPFPFNLQDGYIVETKVRHESVVSGLYGGVLPSVSSSPYTASRNSNGDATVLYMREQGIQTVYYWIASGRSASYDIADAVSTGWNPSDGIWYITGISIFGGEVKLWRDGEAIITITGINWAKNLRYIKLGSFHRDVAYNLQDTSYDWVRVRKYVSPEPTVSLGSEETSPIIKLTMINLGIELGKRYLIKLIYEDGKIAVRNITLDKNLSSGESKEIYLTDLPKGIIKKIEIYSIDVCPNMLVGIRSVNIEV